MTTPTNSPFRCAVCGASGVHHWHPQIGSYEDQVTVFFPREHHARAKTLLESDPELIGAPFRLIEGRGCDPQIEMPTDAFRVLAKRGVGFSVQCWVRPASGRRGNPLEKAA